MIDTMKAKTVTVTIDVLAREMVGRFIRERKLGLRVKVDVFQHRPKLAKGPHGWGYGAVGGKFYSVRSMHLDHWPLNVPMDIEGNWKADNRTTDPEEVQFAEGRRDLIDRYRDKIDDAVQAAMGES